MRKKGKLIVKKGKIYLGIFDDHGVQRQLLHHILEREKYEVNYSAATLLQLEEYFEHNQVNILLVHNRSVTEELLPMLAGFMKETGGTLKVIFYGGADNGHFKLPA